MDKKLIHCCGCDQKVNARLTNGEEIYPHKSDLYLLPFWKCDVCNNFVGCHHKTKNRTQPLGNIPTPELREYRKKIHSILDPLWKSGAYTRKEIYERISKRIGWKYHTAKIKTVEEAEKIIAIVKGYQRKSIWRTL